MGRRCSVPNQPPILTPLTGSFPYSKLDLTGESAALVAERANAKDKRAAERRNMIDLML